MSCEGYNFDVYVSNADVNSYNLEAIRGPTAIVHTKDDQLASHDASQRAAARIPRARFVSLESGGHLMLGQTKNVEVFQGLQVALAVASNHPVEPTIAALFSDAMFALSVIGYVPLAVMLTAVAMVSLRDHAFSPWLGTLSAFAAVAQALMSIGLIVENGPLVPGGMLTYGLYAVTLLWLVATTTVMVRSGRPQRFEAINPGGVQPL